MMNSFYYGKSGKGDYRKEDLPKNRKQLFFEMLRVRFSGLVRLNLIYMLPMIPAMVVIAMSVLAWALNLSSLVEELGDTATAWVQMQDVQGSLFYTGLLFLIPCILITGPFTAGIAYVTRNWARDEHSFVWSDFKDAMKQNWKQALITSGITSVMPLIIYICFMTYGQLARDSALYVAPQALVVMLGAVWSLMLLYMYPLMVSYTLSYRQLLKNALLLAIGRLPQSLLMRLISLVPLLISVVVFYFTAALEIILVVVVLLYMVIFFALNRFIYASFTNAVFDKYINAHIEGAVVNRGMAEDDDEYDEDDEQDS